jgi:hypothetical protein
MFRPIDNTNIGRFVLSNKYFTNFFHYFFHYLNLHLILAL